ncbi:hypothetical protein HYU11_02010 [Candidatus Woesearchaeota archaeon]|nr:hypothetical protein [Candidatus Woesearchaeota archaeon]
MADQKQALKVVKKKWVTITATKSFDESVLGESLVASPSELKGRIISVNLATLTDDIKQQHISLKFVINEVENDKAVGELIAFEVMPAAIKRLVRRGATRIDSSFVCETADGKKARIKPFLLTKAYAKGLISKKLRKMLNEHIASEVKKVSFDDLVRTLIGNKLQTNAKQVLKKVYPVRSCEIKSVQVVLKGNILKVSEELPAEEKAEEEQ